MYEFDKRLENDSPSRGRKFKLTTLISKKSYCHSLENDSPSRGRKCIMATNKKVQVQV